MKWMQPKWVNQCASRMVATLIMASMFVGVGYAQTNLPLNTTRADGLRLNDRLQEAASNRINKLTLKEQQEPRARIVDLTTVRSKHIKYLTFMDETTIRGGQNVFAAGIEFTLFMEGEAGAEQTCWSGARPTVFFVPACSGDAACLAKTNRMGSMLLSAKLANQPVTIAHDGCIVREVTLGE